MAINRFRCAAGSGFSALDRDKGQEGSLTHCLNFDCLYHKRFAFAADSIGFHPKDAI